MARITMSRVASRTLSSPLVTRDTVMGETPALRATSWMVTAVPRRRRVRLTVVIPRPSAGPGPTDGGSGPTPLAPISRYR